MFLEESEEKIIQKKQISVELKKSIYERDYLPPLTQEQKDAAYGLKGGNEECLDAEEKDQLEGIGDDDAEMAEYGEEGEQEQNESVASDNKAEDIELTQEQKESKAVKHKWADEQR